MAGIASMVDLIFFVCSLSSLYYPAVCSHRDLILYTITVGKITAVQAPCYIYRRQNYKHNSNFIPKTFANLIEPKMWPLCMARNGGPSVDVRIHSWPGLSRAPARTPPISEEPLRGAGGWGNRLLAVTDDAEGIVMGKNLAPLKRGGEVA